MARRRGGARARSSFWARSAGVTDPEQKRHIIGEEFVRVQERIIESRRLLDEQLDSGPGHHLPGHHRIRRHGQGGAHQDASQPRGRHSEADRERAHRGAAEIVLQGRGARGGPRARAARRAAGPASVPRARAWRSAACARNSTRRCARRRRAGSCRCIRWACRAIRAATRRCWRSTRWITTRATALINRLSGVNRVIARGGDAGAVGGDARCAPVR